MRISLLNDEIKSAFAKFKSHFNTTWRPLPVQIAACIRHSTFHFGFVEAQY